MDYTTQALGFKIKKTLRYIRLYGVQRTWMKVKGQYHMKKQYATLPPMPSSGENGGRVGLIGCGNYAFSNIAYYLHKQRKNVIRGAMDKDVNKAASLFEAFGLQYYTDDANKIIADPKIELVYIASNHASHAEYAIECIREGKHVHIEKPHVVSRDQLDRLTEAMQENSQVKVFLGFNRPRSSLFRKLQEYLVRESGPLMINWFIAGHEIPDDHWYFDEAEGGRVLGNLCHWTDLTLHMVTIEKAFPCTIVPATPENAKSDCVVSIIFANHSCASITFFAAKGHAFEGVREVLSLQKGNVLANLVDFQKLSVEIAEKRHRFVPLYRDHGHEANILHSFDCLEKNSSLGEDPRYVKATAMFFLAIKDAIDSGQTVTLTRQDVEE